MVVKVKEPVEKEYVYFREGLVLFTYLHLAPLPELTDKLLEKKVIGIAYETVRDRAGTLPLLTPMSEVAGRMSVQVGAAYLEKEQAAAAFCWAASPAFRPRSVCIIGGGIVGTNAAKIALGMGAKVTIVDREPEPPARAGRHLRRPPLHAGLQQLQHRPKPCERPIWSSAACSFRARLRPRSYPRDGREDEEGRGDRRRRHRSGRLR